jgi:protein-disulfide isomerase
MPANRRDLVTALGAAGLLGACGQNNAASAAGGGGARSKYEVAGDMALGDPNAPAVLVEYASVTCSHCKSFHEDILPTLKTKYVATNRLRYVFREFATPPREYAYAGFLIARCAGTTPEKYFQIIDALFAQQMAIFEAAAAGTGRDKMLEIAKAAGLSEERFTSCISDPAGAQRLNTVEQKAIEQFKINKTPTLILNGEEFSLPATGGLEALSAAIEAKGAANK